jgi:hypothetical protein
LSKSIPELPPHVRRGPKVGEKINGPALLGLRFRRADVDEDLT